MAHDLPAPDDHRHRSPALPFNAKIERYPDYLGRLVLRVSARALYGVREHPGGNPARIILNSWL